MSIYIYSVIDSNKIPEDLQLIGINNNPLFCIPFLDIGAVCCDFTGEISDLKTCVMKHEKVVESLMENYTVLPMRFQTTFKKRDDAISSIEKYYNDFKDNLIRLSGKLEYGAKVIWPADKIRECIIKNSSDIGNSSLTGNTPAVEYLKEKYKKYKIDMIFKRKADDYIAQVDKYFSQIAIEKKLKKLQTDKLLLNAAYLIDKTQKEEIIKIFQRIEEEIKDLEFLFSGPWPAYNFIKMSIK